jgi:methionine-rich copper-binding protein CopC
MKRGIAIAGFVLIATFVMVPAPAEAHAFLDHSDPKVGSTVSQSPPALTLVFTEGVEPAFSRIEVTDEAGTAIEAKQLEHPQTDTLRVALPSLKPGTYKVHWSVVSVDTHATEGTFRFSVKAP